MPVPATSVSFSFRTPNVRRSWLPYFLAAIGAGAAVADEEIMRYYWVMPDAVSQKSPRLIRVMGEKGERYEELYADETIAALKLHPAIQEARLARQAALRKEAQRLAKQLRESGKEPLVAYEEAWTEVYRKNWLNAGGMNESCRLDDMLARLASEKGELNLTESEQQWLLEALLEDDDRLESEAGQELLRRLAAQLRRMGYGNLDKTLGVNDELMKRFAEAMRHMPDSMNAFRDALFKTNRGSVGNHALVGFRAPWGIKVGGGWHYHQAPLQVETTEGSGNTQLPAEIPLTVGSGQSLTGSAIVEIPGATDDFLVTSPEQSEKKEKDEEEDDTLTREEDEPGQVAAAPAMMMRSFSMRSSAPATFAASQDDDNTAPEDAISGNPNTLYWASGPGESAVWDTNQTTTWIDGNGTEVRYTSGASVEFCDTEGLNKAIRIAAGGVVADSVAVTGSGYSFSGGNLVVTNRLSVIDAAEFGVTLDVGANRIQGGTLENVQMQVTGDIHRPQTGDTVTVHNLISSADGTNDAVLRNVRLHAGTSTEYATLHNVVFAGNSTLTGYITFEKTQAPGEMGVASGSTLTLDNVTFDLRGLGSGEKVLIKNSGTLNGWDKVHFVYSGVTVNSAAVNTSTAGVVTLYYTHGGNLYWNGTDNMWNIDSKNWSSTEELKNNEVFTALSNVYFGGGESANRAISITQDMVVSNLWVTGGGYSFSGARVAVLGNAYLNPETGNKVTFHDQLVVQGNLVAGLDAEGKPVEDRDSIIELLGTTTVAKNATFNNFYTFIDADMTVGGKFTVNAGDEDSAGSLTIYGNVTATAMEIAVSSGGNNGTGHVNVTGNLTTIKSDAAPEDSDIITIGGTAEQHYLGVVTAGDLTVSTQEHDVYFDLLHVDCLTVDKGAHVHVQTSSAASSLSTSSFPVINLSGTLSLDAPGATYNQGYDVYVQDDAASLVFGTDCTIDNLKIIGQQDASGYTNVDISVQSRSATVTGMENLGDLKVELGSLTVKNAEVWAVHGQLILDKGKLKLGAGSDNIMAFDSGAVYLQYGSSLDIGSTTQTLYARNEAESLSLSGASTITGAADGEVRLENGVRVNYEGIGNSIEAKLTVGQNITLNAAQPEDTSSLEISGLISGSGNMNLTGKGIVVLYGANTEYIGTVTVDNGSTLTLLNADSLSNAGVVLGAGGTLSLNAPGEVNLKALTLQDGSSLAISSIVGTQKASTADAVLNTTNGVTFGQGDVVLNLIFSHELDTMKTYNIMTGVSSIDKLRLNVQHNGAALDDSQYKVILGSDGLLYITTMMGNVWDGESSQYWTKSGNGENWSGDEYREDVRYKAAIFRDLPTDGSTQESETVKVQGKVSPGDIYFTADTTSYTLDSDGDGGLDAGTSIHKLGSANVSLNLTNNATADTALGNVDVQAGSLILGNDLAVKGTVTVEKDTTLTLQGDKGKLIMVSEGGTSPYTASVAANASATLSGVTMDAAGIRGTADVPGSAENLLVQGNAHLADLTLKNFAAMSNEEGNVTLTNVTLMGTGSHALENVTIGQGVVVDASGSYILSGNLTFDSALTNNGTVTLANVTNIEVGKITPTEDAGGYKYTFINGGTCQFIGSSAGGITSDMVSINGVKLSDGLATGITAVFTVNENEKGTFTLSFTGDTVGMPQWDERWGKTENAPAFTRIYAGTAADAYVELAAGTEKNTDYYRYSSIVDGANAAKVNNGEAIVVTLSKGATGNYAVGGLVNKDRVTGDVYEDGHYVHNVEVWIDDRSSIKNIIGGLDNALNNEGGYVTSTAQSGATHVLVEDPDYQKKDSIPNDYREWDKSYVIAGSRWCTQTAESFVTVRSGEIYNVFGGSCGGHYGGACYEHVNYDDPCKLSPDNDEAEWYDLPIVVKQYGTSHVYVEGGRIGEIFAGGVYADLDVGVGNRAVEMVLTGGDLGGADLRVFGGSNHGNVTGDIYVRMEGSAQIRSRLLGGSNAGTVNGDIVLDLISGRAYRVDAAGLGWYQKTEYPNGYVYIYDDPASIKGDVLVNLYKDFELGIGADGSLTNGIYGGREQSNNIILLKGDDGTVHTSTLHFAEGEKYAKLASIVPNGYDTSENSIIVTGFDRFELEDKAHVVLGLGLFDVDMDPSKELVISGKGVVEVIGHGVEDLVLWDNYGKVIKSGESRNLGRNIKLEDSATLKISTSVIGKTGDDDDRTITVKSGSTIDFSGAPAVTGYTGDSAYAGLGFNVVIEGYGVDGKGAIYKGKYDGPQYLVDENATSTANRIVLPNVKLTDNASVKVEAGETLYMNASRQDGDSYVQGDTHLTLNKYTFTKMGAGDFIARSVEMTAGTVLVQQGTFGFDLTDNAAQTDMVLAAGAELKLNATALETAGPTDLSLRSLSGAGTVELNGSTLTLYTNEGAAYYKEYMTDVYTGDASPYDQFSATTGFGYAVFSGLIKDGSGSGGKFAKSGSGVHYISGSSNTYTGGTQLQEGRLYLLGTSEASTFTKDTSNAAAGVAGTGTIVWDSAAAELYLGHGTRIYNNGTAKVDGGVMTIGVEGAFNSVRKGENTVTKDEETYVEIDTRNLKSIDVDAQYADGTEYKSGEDIDRSKMLLVKESDLETVSATVLLNGVRKGENTVTKDGETYVEIDTHNLKAIAVNALYADGTEYEPGKDIDRSKMLLVKERDLEKGTVTFLSDTGYNEAVYSGVLSGGGAKLHKVGVGTLVLDQQNTYTGGTEIDAGTLRVRGWGTLGENVKANAAIVHEGATLMFTHNGGYGDEPTEAANDIRIEGSGDALWANHAATDGGTAALISAVGTAVTFTLSGDISGSGNVRHSGEGKLVLSGDSSYEGGTYVSRGTVEVQSATGLGATASGKGAVTIEHDAALRVTVESGFKGNLMVTTLAADTNDIQGAVYVQGTADTERILHMDGNGYNAVSTTLDANGTLLINGAAINGTAVKAESKLLTGSGNVVVSDASASGTSASFDSMKDYTGDFRVEGDNASIRVGAGSHEEGSIHVAGQQSSVHIGGNVFIAAGESLHLRSTGAAGTDAGTSALLASGGVVGVASGAVFSVSYAETEFAYNLSELMDESSVTLEDLISPAGDVSVKYHPVGADVGTYTGRFDASIAVNKQAVGAVQAAGGLTLAGGATYETLNAHTSLLGGSLTLYVLENNQITLNTDFELDFEADEVQLVLFSDVGSVNFALDGVIAKAGEREGEGVVYYTRADRYLTGSDYVNSQTMLVYDSEAGVVYLQTTRPVPEPATTALSLLAVSGLLARRRRRD